ncbi:MAG TPA: DUF4157 domain-containing protein [Verrucomicrobiota bacterium]|nr:DUF4157 domain-containing protein [Verrucomicrobiota bacterium]
MQSFVGQPGAPTIQRTGVVDTGTPTLPPFIQPKLLIDEPGDSFEPNADGGTELTGRDQSSRDQPVPSGLLCPSQSRILQRKCACGGSAGMAGECEECSKQQRSGLQAKLKVNEPGDIYEQEADRIADQVMAAPAHTAVSSAPPRIQRVSAPSTGKLEAASVSVDVALASPGRPLDAALRQYMEQRFGHEFSRVRVHHDAAAADSASEVDAHAYTVGHDIVFGAQQFSPDTRRGRQLLAHELAHVVQQGCARGEVVRRKPATDTQHLAETLPGPQPFAPDPSRRNDQRFALKQAEEDLTWLQARDQLSAAEKDAIMTRRDFFEGAARSAYVEKIAPMLKLVMTPQIEIRSVYIGDLSDIEESRRPMVRQRRERTARRFEKIKDQDLEYKYGKELDEYLEKGCEENVDVDFEMIEQIIAQRAPNATWHAAAREDFLNRRAIQEVWIAREKSIPSLPQFWQDQFKGLEREIASMDEGMKALAPFARSLLWMWREHVAEFDQNAYIRDFIQSRRGGDLVMAEIAKQFDRVLRESNDKVQKECRENPPSRLMKFWGDPCKSWYGDSTKADDEMYQLRVRMKLMHDPNRMPYRDVIFLLKEYHNAAAAIPSSMGGAHLKILQSVSTVQGSFALGIQPGKNIKPAVIAPPRGPGFLNRNLQKLYLAFGMAVDDLMPEHRNIAGGSIGKRPVAAVVEKVPATVKAPATPTTTATPRTQAPAPIGATAGEIPKPVATTTVPSTPPKPPTSSTPTGRAQTPVAPVAVSPAPVTAVSTAHTAATVTQSTPTTVTPAPGATATTATPTAVPMDREVLVNLASGIFHPAGSHWYRTGVANGEYMSRALALARGYREVGSPAVAPPSGVYGVERRKDGVEIKAWIGAVRADRAGYERELPSAAQYALQQIAEWERAHSTSAGLRIESAAAIRLASRLVNQILQNRGIEDFLRQLRNNNSTDGRLHLQTVTATHERTLRLESIHYLVSFMQNGRLITAFEAVIEMRTDGSARAGVRFGSDKYVFGPWYQN